MYVPDAFAVTEPDEIAAMLVRAPLGCLVTHGPQGLFASHLPLLHRDGRLEGHLARINPHRSLDGDGEALVVFPGPDAYVSPGWYPSKAEHGRVVPTWNYETVHVYGALTWHEDRDWLLANVAALSDRFEAAQDRPWSVADAPADYVSRLAAGIVGVELRITRIEAKRKLSQNRGEADRQGVLAGLERGGETAIAALMRTEP
jgi:transcriptional regulator